MNNNYQHYYADEKRKYDKAKQDFLKTCKSFSELSDSLKTDLFVDLVGDEAFVQFLRIMQQYFG